jgi:hypothetical protein
MKHIHKTNDAIYITSDEQPYIVEVCENKIEEIKKPKQETTLEEASERFYGEEEIVNDYDISGYLQSAFINGAKWQQEQIGKSEFLQKLRATLSDAEARRLIFETFKKK